MNAPSLIAFNGKSPVVPASAFVALGARLIGDVELGEQASVWYNCVLRADVNRIRIGARSNIQDGTVIHCDSGRTGHDGFPTLIGDDCLVGHMAMLHGCVLEDRAFVGLGSVLMDGTVIESDGMLAAGALLTPGKRILAGQLWAGRPAKYLRDLSPEEIAGNGLGVAHYVHNAAAHAAAVTG